MSVLVTLDASATQYAYRVAQQKAEQYRNFAHEHYRNDARSHFVGRLGELAAYKWMKEAGLNPVSNFDNGRNDLPDITVAMRGSVEVKTWRCHQWPGLGRAISLKQLPHILEADVVFWMTVDIFGYAPVNAVDCWVMGWNKTTDFSKARPISVNSLNSVQMSEADVRDPLEFS